MLAIVTFILWLCGVAIIIADYRLPGKWDEPLLGVAGVLLVYAGMLVLFTFPRFKARAEWIDSLRFTIRHGAIWKKKGPIT
jgi:hypothetical protein